MNDRKNIVIIEPIGGHGGMDYYDYGLSFGLAQNKLEVHLCTSSETQTIEFDHVHTHKFFSNVWNSKNKLTKFKNYMRGLKKSINLAEDTKSIAIHLHFFEFGLLEYVILRKFKKLRIKIILTLHDIESFNSSNAKWIERKCMKLVDHVIVHNKICKEELEAKNIVHSVINVIPHGNYLPFIEESEVNNRESDNVLRLLFFGQIKDVKGLDILLHGMKKLSNHSKQVHLTIAGKPWKASLEKYVSLIAELDLSEIVTTKFEYIANEEVKHYFAQADIVVLPYKRIYQSGVLLMAMSYGKPVLASDLEAFKEVITDKKTGYLFASEDPDDLAKVLMEIAGNAEQMKTVSRNAMTLLETEYDWAKIGRMTKIIYSLR